MKCKSRCPNQRRGLTLPSRGRPQSGSACLRPTLMSNVRPHHLFMDTLELKIPPPLVALIVALLMWLTASVTAPMEVQFVYRLCAALALALAGSAVRLAAQIAFWRASTTVNPIKPDHTSGIVSSGVYRFTRNPMYLGRALQLFGWASFLASPIAFLLVPLYLVYVNRFQVVPEERALLAQFGPAYEVYQGEVPRWL